jgi:uncharacterized membrane protein
MESRVKVLGHPVHPMLIVFPVGLLITAVVIDVASIWRDAPGWAATAQFNMGAGIVMGLIAAVFGAVDWLAIPAKSRAKRIGAMHALSNVMAIVLFGFVYLQRRGAGEQALLTTPLLMAEVCAFLIMAIGGWLGGELVDRLGVGVDDGANVNAPSSLRSRRPA